ncbi:MAG: hypothetical protein JXR53_00495 [Bacteroidales bacterium]|nr:hypothetical protein [Bacteroidales bacterium]
MRILIIILLTITMFYACKTRKEVKHTIWKMKDGIALIEVESVQEGYSQTGVWEKFDDIPGYTGETSFRMASSGNEYMDPLPHDAEKTDTPYKLTYRIYVPEAGEYQVRIYNYHWLKDGDNDAWIGINDDLYEKIWDHDTLVWSWNEAIAWQLAYQPRWFHKGVNTISIVGRSENWVIDRLAIVKEGIPDEKWQGTMLPESEKLILNEKPDVPAGIKIKDIGYSFAFIEWEEAENAVAYQIFVNDVYQRSTFKTEASISNLLLNNENTIGIVAENSFGEVSKMQEINVKTTKENVLEVNLSNSDLNWEEVDDCSFSESSQLKVLAIDTVLVIKLYTKFNKGYINVSIDPDNSKDETFSMADRLYYSKIEAPMLKERVDRYSNVKRVEFVVNEQDNGLVGITMAIPFKTMGHLLKSGDLFGLRVWISKGEKGEDPIELILGEDNQREVNFPYTFKEMLIVE